jgi:ferredoxin
VSVVRVSAACVGCGACLATCPERAFVPVPPGPGRAPLVVREDACTGCLECLEICPVDAIDPVSRSA